MKKSSATTYLFIGFLLGLIPTAVLYFQAEELEAKDLGSDIGGR